MDVEAAKMIGAGIAALPLAGAGIGLGMIFSSFLTGAFRNPSAAAGNQQTLLLGFALTEFTGLLAFVVAIIILFVV
ncbi:MULTISPECIES: F0F1 ATP synthase subunit C [Aquisalinus]|uniref:ATP synthase subunit c n=2 Tax=Aquisalinus TaxID=1795639 RepID=A0A8J2Y6Y3_9PROT|nr:MULTISPECIES: F0F1 ATP synthase subunit C [Aquisalinus]MBD0426727.1 F0F1 ATP synthase subunit C [Aquisalinus flavus]NHK28721.1 F0F1 ATP synthase subunit C [Aquisalinus luteolus]UNE46590.1 F0F1 ATP synthase subunit C [Aquisalinus flavus]GGC95498.1 F0F1 ATP synthase subunit C [Aquisalinus flavus]GGH99317.1 F0F1 ATP synthase subunit C [Aquisalinus luteolus]